MKVLIGCEYSATEREAFAALGWDAWSCDLLPSDRPGNHHQGDVFELLHVHHKWDLIILHPPCTAMSLSGNGTYGCNKPLHQLRIEALDWTEKLWSRACGVCGCVALENPSSVLCQKLGKRTQEIHPWQFGHPEQKKTWLWLKGLPPLKPTNDVYDEMMKLPENKRQRIFYMGKSPTRGHERSKAYPGTAAAMAQQWTAHIQSQQP